MIDSLLNVLGGRLAQADTTTIEYRRAKFDYDFVNNDKSCGVHNFMYSEDLLRSSIENLPVQGLVKGVEETPPLAFLLHPSRPNPFNSSAIISFVLPTGGQVCLRIYDTAGREVANLVDAWQGSGTHEVAFDGSSLATGIYLARLTAGNYTAVQKLILMK